MSMTIDQVQNFYTGELLMLMEMRETITDGRVETVYLLSDGSEWDSAKFHANWRVIKSE
jgi:hypothetical protein